MTHVRALRLVLVVQDLPQHVNRGVGLDGDAGLHALLVNVADEFARAGATGGEGVGWAGGGDGVDGRFVVEAVQVAPGLSEVLDPAMGLESQLGFVRRFRTAGSPL